MAVKEESELVDTFKQEFNAEASYDLEAHKNRDDCFIGEDCVTALIPKHVEKFGVIQFDELTKTDKLSMEYVEVDDELIESYYFEKNGETRHHVTSDYVGRALELLDKGGMYLHENSYSDFSRGDCYPVALDTNQGYWIVFAPIALSE